MWRVAVNTIAAVALLFASVATAGYVAAQDPVEGILVNQTVTVAGQEFHAAFAAMWADKPGVAGYAVLVRERPSAARGTTIEVEHAGRLLFRAFLPPTRAQVRPLAAQAVDAAYEAALASQVQPLLPADGDLAPDEI
ncbi:curli production assembly/transport protein CsgE [Massilia agilis]|uniref:Curli production assembly/transport component CsgE n=1 Tax=Massilia agilis TaxID=1811226 RepID=A0ABT2D7R7_9BURK|nr:curli production assembly/transport protein CsgE [Massilia agilis]MCS0806436.1 curli production assembly/transport protein CsgE [Massilia agilis]